MTRRPLLALAALALAPSATRASAPGDPVVAARRAGPIVIDGRVDEPAWAAAPVHDGFFQQFPKEGEPPSERTEVRVLYDDHALYVGVVALDSRPSEVSRPLGRRDRAPASDAVAIFIDSDRGRRSAFFFELNAAGVQTDGILFADDSASTEWDAVWDGNAAPIAGGWSAEFRIPLSVLRFSKGEEIAFGFGVRRILARTHETLLSVVIPRSVRGSVARLGALVGLNGLRPAHAFEVSPYVASRATLRPRSTNGDPPRPRNVDPVGQVGLDLRSSLGRALSLQATLNPDFGQVEADELVQNLSTFEIFFPEKRPFFTQGMELFQPVTAPGRPSPQQLFYSRRIGLDAPILGAAKLSGNASSEVQVGLAEAFVAGAGLSGETATPPRGFAYEPSQPLWFGPKDALPALSPVTRNFATGVVRWRPTTETSFGGTFASAVPFGPRCTQEESNLDDDVRPKRCDALGGNAAALDFTTRSHDGEWFALGQVTGSQSLGGPPTRTLLDGTTLSRGDLGWGAHAAAGRGGGEPWRFDAAWEYESPRLDVNATGFQRTQNEQLGRAALRYVQLHPRGGPFHYYGFALGAQGQWTTDGRGLLRDALAFAASEFQLRSYHWFGCNLTFDAVHWDVREIQQAGAPMRRPASVAADCWTSTDTSRPLSFEVGAGAGHAFAAGPLAPIDFGGTVARVAARPHPRVETRLEARWEWNRWRARWVATENGSHWLADLTAPVLSFTLRQQVVLTRRLTLQAYAQLFTTHGHYGAYYRTPDGPRRVSFSDLEPTARPTSGDASDPEFHTGALNVNVVLRWEYRTGSTLFVVYTRGQEESDWSGRNPPFSLAPQGLASGPTTDTFLVKWSHYWSG